MFKRCVSMASDDMHTQLAGLLGKRATEIVSIRMTHEDPPAISVIDVVQVITGMAKNNAGNYFERMKTTHPEVSTNCRNYRFRLGIRSPASDSAPASD